MQGKEVLHKLVKGRITVQIEREGGHRFYRVYEHGVLVQSEVPQQAIHITIENHKRLGFKEVKVKGDC